jgi:long-chain acyl-CoA synthetase
VQVDDTDSRRTYTYAEFVGRVRQCVGGLTAVGVRHGDRVCVLLPNCTDYPVIFLATLQLGAIFVPINTMYTKGKLLTSRVDWFLL